MVTVKFKGSNDSKIVAIFSKYEHGYKRFDEVTPEDATTIVKSYRNDITPDMVIEQIIDGDLKKFKKNQNTEDEYTI